MKKFYTVPKKIILVLLLSLLIVNLTNAQTHTTEAAGPTPIGRWDLTVDMGDKIVPSWLEVKLSGVKTLVGYFVAEGGSARPVAKINFNDGKISFTIPPQWERNDKDMVFEGMLKDDKLSGTIYASTGKVNAFTGVRAPSLKRDKEPTWGTPIQLFNGKDLSGWHTQNQKTSGWLKMES